MMEWHPTKRFGFRFAFALLPLLCCELLASFSPLVAYRPFALWRFVGSSGPYMVFSGVMECLGAYMLFWRRTTTLGSILLATVLVNVVMLNFCYGVPIKRLSVTLLALALFLELHNIRRVLDFVLSHRPTAPLELRPFPMSRRYDIARRVVKTLWIVSTTGLVAWGMARARAMPLPKLWGVYDVEELRRNDVAAPLVITDAKIWQQVAFGRNFGPSAVIVTVDGERHVFDVDVDEDKGELVLDDADDKKVTLQIKHIDATHLELRGDYYGEQLDVRLRGRDISQLTLTARGFHWVDDGGFWR
jgi:hypothetical protein